LDSPLFFERLCGVFGFNVTPVVFFLSCSPQPTTKRPDFYRKLRYLCFILNTSTEFMADHGAQSFFWLLISPFRRQPDNDRSDDIPDGHPNLRTAVWRRGRGGEGRGAPPAARAGGAPDAGAAAVRSDPRPHPLRHLRRRIHPSRGAGAPPRLPATQIHPLTCSLPHLSHAFANRCSTPVCLNLASPPPWKWSLRQFELP